MEYRGSMAHKYVATREALKQSKENRETGKARENWRRRKERM